MRCKRANSKRQDIRKTRNTIRHKIRTLEDYILEQIFGTGKGRGHKEEKNLIKQEIQKL